MKRELIAIVILTPLPALGQYIGNPTGKIKSLNLWADPFVERNVFGHAGFEGGFISDWDFDFRDDVFGGTIDGQLDEPYGMFTGGAHLWGFEIEGKLGGIGQDVELDDDFPGGPSIFDDFGSAGFFTAASARFGVSPVYPLRLGGGAQIAYSFAVDDIDFGFVEEDLELDLFRAQVFGGIGVDLRASDDVLFAPYAGIGGAFLDGELHVDHHDIGELSEDDALFFFGGCDLHLFRHLRLGVEGQVNNGPGWSVAASVSVYF